jgi:3-methyladenine DNA glycosylase AlkD
MNTTIEEIMLELESKGDANMRKVHQKNGGGDRTFGVKMGDIRAMAKKRKKNPSLGLALWDTGQIDARLLAVLLLSPEALNAEQLTAMVASEPFPWVADWFHAYLLKDHPAGDALRQVWIHSDNKMLARAAWALTAGCVARNPERLDIPALLDRIEREMAHAPAEVQWTMNTTLAQIGICHPAYRERAVQIGESLGIYRDYKVSKGCTSPYAPAWIHEMVRRQEGA